MYGVRPSLPGHPPTSLLQAGPYNVDNLPGEIFIETLGLDPTATTRDLGVLVGWWAALSLLAMALFLLRLPRQPGGSAARRWWRRQRKLRPVAELAPPPLPVKAPQA